MGRHTKLVCLLTAWMGALVGATDTMADGAKGAFSVEPVGSGSYGGHQGEIDIAIDAGEKKEIVTVIGDMPVGSNVGFHYHPGYAFVAVTKGQVASFDSAGCEASHTYEAGEAFLDFPGHKHDIVNVGDEPAQFVVTFLLPEGEEPLYPVDDPGTEACN